MDDAFGSCKSVLRPLMFAVYIQGPWLPNLELTMPNSRPISGTAHEVIDFGMLNFITMNNVL